jgi:hypothetical protein
MLAAMERQSFEPAGAGAVLAATTGVTTGIGISAGIFAVYRRYRGYFGA